MMTFIGLFASLVAFILFARWVWPGIIDEAEATKNYKSNDFYEYPETKEMNNESNHDH